jgi:hypothetical protein
MTDDLIRDTHDIQVAAFGNLTGAIPERTTDMESMWRDLEPKFQLTPDILNGDRIILDAGAYRYVRFNHRVMRAFWIAGCAAWEGYRAVAEAPSLGSVKLDRFKELVSAFETTISNDGPELETLPSGVAEPGQYADKAYDVQGCAAAELATIAVAWAFLHELRHIRYQREGTAADAQTSEASAKHDEEFSCDRCATTFILRKVDDYAAATGEPADSVRRKRQLGIYFGLFAITLLAKDKWDATETHPSVEERIQRVRSLMVPPDEIAAAIAHVAFASLAPNWPGSPRMA